ncbi:MAG TPA: PQQ-binding-like beta-propeller repeat protein [Mycobacteriales bacterium]|nr:PQQ-binding-like beta-propeller repeat protein [Mycobacteriales bacterium]
MLAIAALLAVIAVPVVGGSDWWNTRLRVAASPPPNLGLADLPGTVRARWRLPGGIGDAAPVVDSTVVVAGAHDIVGRDPISGQVRWQYQRNNATLCDWVTVDGAVVAAFRHHGGCGDLVALDGGTGQRRWYRNAAVGSAVTLTAGPGVVVAGGRTSLVAYDPESGLERWTYTKAGCAFDSPVAGDLGVAVILTCRGQAGQAGQGPLLALHGLVGKNERWSVPLGGTQPHLLAASERVAVYGTFPSGPAVTLFDATGRQVGAVTGPDLALRGQDVPTATTFLSTLVTWTGTRVVAVDLIGGRIRWSGSASGPPAGQTTTVVYPDGAGFVERGPTDGQVLDRVSVGGVPPGPVSRLARVGRIIVAAGANGMIMYG